MKWYLLFQILTTWPQSPQPIQIQGPFDAKEVCEQIKEKFDTFAIKSKCVSIQDPVAK